MREIAKVAFRLFLIMILAGLCLGATYTVTKDPIAQQELLQQEADRRAVLPRPPPLRRWPSSPRAR